MKKLLAAAAMLIVFTGCSTVDKAKRNLIKEIKRWDTVSIKSEYLEVSKKKGEKDLYYKIENGEYKLITEENFAEYLMDVVKGENPLKKIEE